MGCTAYVGVCVVERVALLPRDRRRRGCRPTVGQPRAARSLVTMTRTLEAW